MRKGVVRGTDPNLDPSTFSIAGTCYSKIIHVERVMRRNPESKLENKMENTD